MSYWVGLDAGGQSVKAVLVDHEGRVAATAKRATGRDAGIAQLAESFAEIVAEFSEHGDTETAIGVGIAGCVGTDGVVHGSPNLPKIAGLQLRTELVESLGRPVVIDNDAHCHALAEGWVGAIAGVSEFLLLALGSGVGSGLVLGGRVHHGATGYGCELGHMIVVAEGRRCPCGNRGCFEAYCSEVGARSMVEEGEPALRGAIDEMVRERGYGYAQAVFELADAGDAHAGQLADSMLRMLGTGIASAVNAFDVLTIVIGGGIAPAVFARIGDVRDAMQASLFAREESSVRLIAAGGGADAGAIGAARLAMFSL